MKNKTNATRVLLNGELLGILVEDPTDGQYAEAAVYGEGHDVIRRSDDGCYMLIDRFYDHCYEYVEAKT
jgi:hypothetical protein